MTKYFKIFTLGVCILLYTTSLAFAVYPTDTDNTIYFRKNVTFSGSDGTGLGTQPTSITDASAYTIDSDKLYVEFWEAMWHGGFWYCYCCASDLAVTVTSTAVSGGMDQDSVVLTLKDYVYSTSEGGTQAKWNKFINAFPGNNTTLGTSPTPSSAANLEVEDSQQLSMTWSGCMGDPTETASDTATAYVADDTTTSDDLVVRVNDSSFASGSETTCNPGDTLYIQVKDTDENHKGYSAETVTVTVRSRDLGDSVSLTLTETDTDTGIFQYADGLATADATAATLTDSILQVAATGGTNNIIVDYTDDADDTPSASLESTSATLSTGAALSSFSVSASSTQVAGTPFDLTITALKSDGTTLTSYTGTLNLTRNFVSPASGSSNISPTSTSGVSFSSGVATVSMTYADCGTITITATDTNNKTGTSSNITFVPYDFSLIASGLDTAVTTSSYARHMVNKPFTLTITARNASGSTTPNYTGTANLTLNYTSPSSSQSGALATSSLTSGYWSAGIATLSSQTYNKWGTIRITCTDATLTTQTGISANVVFLPKDFSLSLSSPKRSRTYFYPNEKFSCTVTARDYNSATLSNYQGTVSFSGSGLGLPADYTFTTSDSGTHTFSDLYGSSQTSTNISVKDATYTSITSASSSITVKSGTIKVISTTTPVGKAKVSVKLVGSDGSVLSEDDSTTFKVKLSEAKADNSASSDATATAVTITDGLASIYVTDNEAEKVTVTPISVSEDLTKESGTVTFGSLSGAGIAVPLWREIREPTEEGKR